MSRSTLLLALISGALILGPAFAAAYETRLNDSDIREAYFLGTGPDAQFMRVLEGYAKRLPMPKSGPQVAEIGIETPFLQVALRSHRATLGWSSQKASENYRKRPAQFVVRVEIELTPSYGAYLEGQGGGVQERSPDFWQDFHFRVAQAEELVPEGIHGRPIYSGDGEGGSLLAGAEVYLRFNPIGIESAPLYITIVTPDGQKIMAEFDLTTLK